MFQNLFSDWSARQGAFHQRFAKRAAKAGPATCAPKASALSSGATCCAGTRRALAHPGLGLRLNNMVNEVYEDAQCGILPFSIDRTSLGWLSTRPRGTFPTPTRCWPPLNKAYLAISQHMPCDLAFYVSPGDSPKGNQQPGRAAAGCQAKQRAAGKRHLLAHPAPGQGCTWRSFWTPPSCAAGGCSSPRGWGPRCWRRPCLSGHLGGDGGNRPAGPAELLDSIPAGGPKRRLGQGDGFPRPAPGH